MHMAASYIEHLTKTRISNLVPVIDRKGAPEPSI